MFIAILDQLVKEIESSGKIRQMDFKGNSLPVILLDDFLDVVQNLDDKHKERILRELKEVNPNETKLVDRNTQK